MAARTIPAPHEHEVELARFAITSSAVDCGLDVSDPRVAAFIDNQVDCAAQRAAELRWLNNIVHKCTHIMVHW